MKKHYKILAFIYAVVLIWAIIFKMNNFDTILNSPEWKIDNICYYLDINSTLPPYPIPPWYFSLKTNIGITNMLNLLAFIPFGFCAAANSKKTSVGLATFYSFLFSLALETFQFFYFVGGFQLLDLAFNTISGMIGAALFCLLMWVGNLLPVDFSEKIAKAFTVLCYIAFTSVALFGTVNTALHIDFYIERQLIWMRAVREFYQN